MYQVKYGDGTVREFDTDDFATACKMANAYSGPILSVKKSDSSPVQAFLDPPEANMDSTNRAILKTAKRPRRR